VYSGEKILSGKESWEDSNIMLIVAILSISLFFFYHNKILWQYFETLEMTVTYSSNDSYKYG